TIAERFIFARDSSLIRPRVFSVSGTCSEITSAVRRTSSRSTSRAPAVRADASVAKGSCATTVMPKAAARRATSLPTRPMPTSASTSPRRAARSASFRPVVWRTSQRARSNARPSSARGSATWTMCFRLATGRDRVGRGTAGGAGRGTRGLLGALRVGPKRRADRDSRLDRLVQIAERELERAEEGDDVLQRHEPQMSHADELSFHLALAAGDDRVVVVAQDANEIASIDARRWPERGDRGG